MTRPDKLTITVDGPESSGVTRLVNVLNNAQANSFFDDAIRGAIIIDASRERDGKPDTPPRWAFERAFSNIKRDVPNLDEVIDNPQGYATAHAFAAYIAANETPPDPMVQVNKLIDAFDEAAQAFGWSHDQGVGDEAAKDDDKRVAARKALHDHIASLIK